MAGTTGLPWLADSVAAGPFGATTFVALAVLGAAMLHAAWNAAAHRIPDRAVGLALISVSYTVIGAAIVPWVSAPQAAAWPFLLASVAVHWAYVALLVRSYELGDFAQAYPLARGTSPLLVAAVSVTVVGQSLTALQGAGVLVLCGGFAVLIAGGGIRRTGLPAVLAAVATGITIAGYTTLDGVGVHRAHATAGYIAWLFLLEGPLIPAAVWLHRRDALARAARVWPVGLASGVVSFAAYGIVIWAQTRGTLAQIAALRETSILFGAVIGVLLFGERLGRWRIAGAACVAGGVILLTV